MNTPELNRLLENLIKKGEIAQTDAAAGLVRVQIGSLLTDWLPYFVPAAGGVSVHRPPSVGEFCLILSPSGETANGVVLCGIQSNSYPKPSASSDETVVQYPDGTTTRYNHQSGQMSVEAAAALTINAPQTTITGKLNVQGLLTYESGMAGTGGGAGTTISGSLNHSGGNLTSNGITLHTHHHPGDSGGTTGAPQ